MHVGLLSSSLGSFGADGCPDVTSTVCPNMATSTSNDDHGRLVTRSDPCSSGDVATWNNEGFLAWAPLQKLKPPGEGQLGSTTSPGLIESVHDLVLGDGQEGCGFTSQNESWYRFLVDPSPYQSILLSGMNVQTTGIDNTLLQQRADFLRSDSLLAIVVVTDKTDASIKESSFYPLVAQLRENGMPFHLPTARSECTSKGPNDPCCASCGESPPTGCPPSDAVCVAASTYTDANENLALRALGLSGGRASHKARYGIEFFYPPSRYIDGLTLPLVQDDSGSTLSNPIFSHNVNDPGAAVRDPSLVIYATITGVPWQLIARQLNGVPDLVGGVSALDATQVGGFKTYEELALTDGQGNPYWDDIAGDPESYVPPLSPFMRESTTPRTGTDPITGIAVSPPGSPSGTNPMNGHERTITKPAGDIEYACVFPLATPIDCSKPGTSCDCNGDASEANPLCAPNPGDNQNLTLQIAAKAYPGVKNLAIAKGMQDQGVVASICAKQTTAPAQPDYGYRPAIKTILTALQHRIAGQCLPQQIASDGSGEVACTVLLASRDEPCDCSNPGRSPVTSDHQCLVDAAHAFDATHPWTCFCEIPQLSGSALIDCENDALTAPATAGWCYIDAGFPAVGNAAFVASCPSSEKHLVRFAGTGTPDSGSTVFLSCQR